MNEELKKILNILDVLKSGINITRTKNSDYYKGYVNALIDVEDNINAEL